MFTPDRRTATRQTMCSRECGRARRRAQAKAGRTADLEGHREAERERQRESRRRRRWAARSEPEKVEKSVASAALSRAEFAAGDLGHRSFVRELSETRNEPGF